MDANAVEVLENGTFDDSQVIPPDESPDALPTTVDDGLGELADALDGLGSKVDDGFSDLDHKLLVLKRNQSEILETVNGTGVEDEENGTQVVQIDANQLQAVESHLQRIGDIGSLNLFISLVCALVVSALLGTLLWSAFSKGWRN